jgi:hypothetical protein
MQKWPQAVGLPFFCNVRTKSIVRGPHTVDLPKRSGCATVGTSIEAASDRIRYELHKRRLNKASI